MEKRMVNGTVAVCVCHLNTLNHQKEGKKKRCVETIQTIFTQKDLSTRTEIRKLQKRNFSEAFQEATTEVISALQLAQDGQP